MVYVIETNLSMNVDKIADHQSRVIEVPSWEEYCAMYKNYSGQACTIGKSLTHLGGNNINSHRIIENLECDDFHLSCDMVWDNELFSLDSRTRHLAYLCDFENTKDGVINEAETN